MEPYQERVVAELKELQDKRAKLGQFLRGPDLTKVSKEEQPLLREQYETMLDYEGILEKRIALYPKEIVGQSAAPETPDRANRPVPA